MNAKATDRPASQNARIVARPSMLHVIAAYSLGSAAPFVVQKGHHGGLWAAVAIGSFAIWSLVISQWGLVQASLTHGWLPFPVWFVGMGLTSIVGITSWSRAILIAGREFPLAVQRSSRGVHGSLMVGLLGLAVPGLGLMLAGCARRAAMAFWSVAACSLSALVLWRARLLWETQQRSASPGFEPLWLERIFIVCMIVVVLGALTWLIQAYEGARVANRIPLRASMQGPWWAVALLVSGAAFFVSFDAAQRAQDLDRLATSMREVGFLYIPLHVQLGSLRLDPSNLAYRMQVAEMYEELGRSMDAAAMREDVLRRWDTYSWWMQEEPQSERVSEHTQLQASALGNRQVGFLLPIQP